MWEINWGREVGDISILGHTGSPFSVEILELGRRTCWKSLNRAGFLWHLSSPAWSPGVPLPEYCLILSSKNNPWQAIFDNQFSFERYELQTPNSRNSQSDTKRLAMLSAWRNFSKTILEKRCKMKEIL